MSSVKSTLYLSLIVQVLTILIGFYAYITDKNINDYILDDIMLIENIVQVVEFTFYISVAFIFTKIPLKSLAKYRYYDWAITTPLMLITTLLFFVYEKRKNNNENKNKKSPKESIFTIIQQEWKNVSKLVLSNGAMLLLGYLQELGKLPLLESNIIGFGFLIYSFYILYQYVSNNITIKLFWVMFIIWSLYGIAPYFNNTTKNTTFNILDIISKNFYGVFLAWNIIYQ